MNYTHDHMEQVAAFAVAFDVKEMGECASDRFCGIAGVYGFLMEQAVAFCEHYALMHYFMGTDYFWGDWVDWYEATDAWLEKHIYPEVYGGDYEC